VACIFCEIVAGRAPARVIWEDPDHLAFLDTKPRMPGHVLVIPKKHTGTWLELPEPELAKLMIASQHVGRMLMRKLKPAHVFEKLIGTEINHVHVHLLPFEPLGLDQTSLEEIEKKILE
jgi:histidine triad (HIT) family protein